MNKLKSIIKRCFPRLTTRLINRRTHRGKIKNYYNSDHHKTALLSYIKEPFKKSSISHTNYFEAQKIAETLHDLGFKVDIIDYRYRDSLRSPYDIIIGFGEVFEEFFSFKFNAKTKTVLYSTGLHQYDQNRHTLERALQKYVIDNVWLLESCRLSDFSWYRQLFMCDKIIVLGNEFAAETFKSKNYHSSISNIPAPFYQTVKYKDILNSKYVNSEKTFIWFGSSGALHKGLDVCIDYFKNAPEFRLIICGNVHKETKFWDFYQSDIENSENIEYWGFVDLYSEKFNQLLRSAFFTIFPSCSEGGSPSQLTVIGNGAMIGILTPQASIDLPHVAQLNDISSKALEQSINTLRSLTMAEIVSKARQNAEFVCHNNSQEIYSKRIHEAISKAVS
tara:strand:- start:2883 stop:4055 length:1173 start_codon:yes stop_codon:yes gene_type:complete